MNILPDILPRIVGDHALHARWLNSLSLMENSGARKIMRSEHPRKVTEMVLKHAAEEARHAYYLKKQIGKLGKDLCPTYDFEYLLAPLASVQYLNRLDTACSRLLREKRSLNGWDLHFAAYLLVTWAIEVRADELYGEYQRILTDMGSKVNVKSIIAEEAGHLAEMTSQMEQHLPSWKELAEEAILVENQLFNNWLVSVRTELN